MTKPEVIIGVDPGRSGALVVLDLSSGRLLSCSRLFKSGVISREAFVQLFEEINEEYLVTLCVIEKVHSRPGNGVKQAFAFGMYSEMVRMVCVFFEYPTVEVVPQTWQRQIDIPKKRQGQDSKKRREEVKLTVKLAALDKWGDIPVTLVAEEGVYDAVWIAEYGRKNLVTIFGK